MKKKNYLINFFLIVIFSTLALYIALYGRVEEVLQYIKQIDGKSFIRILVYGLSYNFVIGFIYMLLIKPYKKDYSFKEGLQVSFVGSYFSGVTPSATGGQFGQAYILKKQGIRYRDGMSVLWKDFIIYQSVLVAYTTLLMLLRFNYYVSEHSGFFLLVLIGYVVNSAVIVLLFTMVLFPKSYVYITKWILQCLSKLHLVKDPKSFINKLDRALKDFTKEIKKFKDQKKLILQCIVLNFIRLTLLYAFPMYIARTMGIEVRSSQLLDIITMSAFVSTANAFIPIPGSSGGTETAFMLIFTTMFTIEQTSSIMIFWRFATYHQIILIGGITFLYLKHQYDQSKNEKQLLHTYEMEGD